MRVLLLDYNGVVVDDEPLHCDSFREILGEEGIPLTREGFFAEYSGLNDRAAIREAFRRAGRPLAPGALERILERKERDYAGRAARQLPIVPGVQAFVAAAAREVRVAVASGAIAAELKDGLARAGIAHLVEIVVSADEVHASKPDPAGFRLALQRLGAGPWDVVVIEDSLPGIAAARALGAGCVAFTTSHTAATLAQADAIWTSFDGHAPGELAPFYRRVTP